MRRPAFTVVTFLSSVLCALAFAMWVRSDDQRSAMRIDWRGSPYAIFSERGHVGVDNSPAIDDFMLERRRAVQRVMAEQQRLIEYLQRTRERDLISSFAPNPRWSASITGVPPAPMRYTVPYWAIILVLLTLPTVWLLDYRRALVRMSRGLCANCGYDLRGNGSGICPECGRKFN
jgi:hypothetical protein